MVVCREAVAGNSLVSKVVSGMKVSQDISQDSTQPPQKIALLLPVLGDGSASGTSHLRLSNALVPRRRVPIGTMAIRHAISPTALNISLSSQI